MPHDPRSPLAQLAAEFLSKQFSKAASPKPEHFAVDLDGTLVEYDGWKGEAHFGKALPGAVEWVRARLAEGHRVTVFTARTAHAAVCKHLVDEGFPELPVTNIKSSYFSVFVDDRAHRFDGPAWFTRTHGHAPWWKPIEQ